MTKKIFIYLSIAFFTLSTSVSAASLKSEVNDLFKEVNFDRSKQSVCTANAKSEISLNANEQIIPASVSKLYVFDYALSKIPTDFRYKTTFVVNKNTLYINGSGDQFFVTEHLASVLKEIAKNKKVKINEIVFSPTFYFNWNQAPTDVQLALFTALKADPTFPLAKAIKVTVGSNPYMGAGTRYEFSSAPFIKLLKHTNNWSTNIATEAIFMQLGGSKSLSAYLKETYDADEEEAYFETGSGLRGNYTTCELTLRVIEHLDQTLKAKGFTPTDVLTVPILDEGVLRSRSIGAEYPTTIAAKSGYINFHHNLAGIINTTKSPIYFGIFTMYQDLLETPTAKKTAEDIANEILDANKKVLKAFPYTPTPVSVSDTLLKKL